MIRILILFLLSLFINSCKTEGKKVQNETTYILYYFHPTARCESCINIENFTKEYIETKYKSKPEIKFIALNIEDSKNEHFKKDYDLKFSSLVISKQKNKIESGFKNLDSVWTYCYDKEGFFEYINYEINEFVND